MKDDRCEVHGVKSCEAKCCKLIHRPEGEQLREAIVKIIWEYKEPLRSQVVGEIVALIQPMIDKARQDGIDHAEMEYNLNVIPGLIDKALKDLMRDIEEHSAHYSADTVGMLVDYEWWQSLKKEE